jgi:hypothetical protein
MQRIGVDGGCGNRLRNLLRLGILVFSTASSVAYRLRGGSAPIWRPFHVLGRKPKGVFPLSGKALMVDCYSVAIVGRSKLNGDSVVIA